MKVTFYLIWIFQNQILESKNISKLLQVFISRFLLGRFMGSLAQVKPKRDFS
jgi:hypothetical protein